MFGVPRWFEATVSPLFHILSESVPWHCTLQLTLSCCVDLDLAPCIEGINHDTGLLRMLNDRHFLTHHLPASPPSQHPDIILFQLSLLLLQHGFMLKFLLVLFEKLLGFFLLFADLFSKMFLLVTFLLQFLFHFLLVFILDRFELWV